MEYIQLTEKINEMCENHKAVSVNGIGESIMGRCIHAITLGQGKKQMIFVGAQRGTDSALCSVMLHFANEYCSLLESQARLFGLPIEYIDKKLSIVLIPMLNPDGVEYCIHGIDEGNPIRERLLAMNQNSEDFSNWNANGRGVDLSKNYNCGYEEYRAKMSLQGMENGAPSGYAGENPESEPEKGYLCNYLRYSQNVSCIIELTGEGNGVSYKGERNIKNAKIIADMLDIREEPARAEDCSLAGWCNEELGIPVFSVNCNLGEVPFVIYTQLRKMLFCAPMLF